MGVSSSDSLSERWIDREGRGSALGVVAGLMLRNESEVDIIDLIRVNLPNQHLIEDDPREPLRPILAARMGDLRKKGSTRCPPHKHHLALGQKQENPSAKQSAHIAKSINHSRNLSIIISDPPILPTESQDNSPTIKSTESLKIHFGLRGYLRPGRGKIFGPGVAGGPPQSQERSGNKD